MSQPAIAPLVVLTRPQGRNDALAARLRESGLDALELPALAIDPLPVDAAQFPLPGQYDLVVFVSGNAARFYLRQLALQGCTDWPADTLAATVGQVSALPLRGAGFIPAQCIVHPALESAQDSEALWLLLQASRRALKRVLIVRGENGREWLGGRLEQAGALVHRHAVYRRLRADWTGGQRRVLADGLRTARPLIGLFTSAESIEAFDRSLSAAQLREFWLRAHFVVIHERIAARLQSVLDAAPGRESAAMVKICPPADEAIFQTVTSLASL